MVLVKQSNFVTEQESQSEWSLEIIKILLLLSPNKLVFYQKIGNPQLMELIQQLWKEKYSENMLEVLLQQGKDKTQSKL